MFAYFIILYIIILSKEEKANNLNLLSEITITIKGKGNQQIIINNSPNRIYINDILQNYTGYYANNLTKETNIIKMEWNTPLSSCSSMFSGLQNITNIDLSKFDTSQLSGNINDMFYNCISLVTINLDNFDTSKIQSMCNLFYNCISLKSLNLSSFVTSNVKDFHYMFFNCISLTTLDLSNFNSGACTCMHNMFNGCSSLISLNLNNFDTSQATSMENMFYRCSSLISLKLNHFSIAKLNKYNNMFTGCNPNITFCIYEYSNYISSQILNIFKNNCSDPCYTIINPKINKENNKCIQNCSFDLNYPYEYNNICYKTCPSNTFISSNNYYLCVDSCNYYNENKTICIDNIPEGYYLNDSFSKIIKKCDIKCKKCSSESISYNNFCITCNIENNYYPKLNDIMTNNSFKDCFDKIPEGFFLNKKNSYYESCYPTCKECKWSGNKNNNNCTKCYNSYQLIGNNCLEICNNYYYFDKIKNEYLCIEECPSDFPYLKYGYICDDECNLIELFSNDCKVKYSNQNIKDELLLKIKNELESGKLDILLPSIIEGENDLAIETYDIMYQIISTNYKNNENKNISIISLGDCEDKLKAFYGISENEPLIIFKIDVYEEGLLIPRITYEVYSKTKKQLNLSICDNTKINVLLPAKVEEKNIFKHNPSDQYYNDDCYIYTTEDGTDITLTDRKSEYINKNMSLCEVNCEYKGYNITSKKAQCECKVKKELSSISEIIKNKDKIINNFPDIKNATNLKIIKCFKVLFTKEGLKKNIGSYILLFIILINIIFLIIFIIKGYKKLFNIIEIIVNKKNKNIYEKKQKNNKKSKNKKNKSKNKKEKNNKKDMAYKTDKNEKDKKNKKEGKINNNKIINNNINIIITNADKNNPLKKNKNKNEESKRNINILKTNDKIKNDKSSTRIKINHDNLKIEQLKEVKVKNNAKESIIKDFNDYELNRLSYKEALQFDKRKYSQYYLSLIKRKQIVIFAFYTKDDYNSRSIKICLFFFSFALSYSVNALFFT